MIVLQESCKTCFFSRQGMILRAGRMKKFRIILCNGFSKASAELKPLVFHNRCFSADFHSRSRQTLFRIALYQLERQSLYALTSPDFKTSTLIELGRSKLVTVTKSLQGNGGVPLSPKHGFPKTTSHVAAFSLQKEAFSAVFSKCIKFIFYGILSSWKTFNCQRKAKMKSDSILC